ncbi:TetR/AcrR family transcriptional regulator [Klebsiella michiganensis]|jgi:AcrR family transcriptional regulator|uniref:TetR/AcrR family transcriptional regulator n=1 Tax=Klebsiella michiganensis TaxID=1134687 RepID=UPI002570BBA2|nr:TetR/AcrR family transcriptional regulator [Klebsiella michiganensis]MDL4454934.1 TetR/AcrR family transcriptional regulator [Klebsiella michiganensis]
MSRRQVIGRDKIIEAAFYIIRDKGAQALTFESLASACGVSKGGIQYSFSSKHDLIEALIDHWESGYDTQMITLQEKYHCSAMEAFVRMTRSSLTDDNVRVQALQAEMLKSEERLQRSQNWYKRVFGDCIDSASPEIRTEFLILFLATEGLHMMKGFNLFQIEEKQCDIIFDTIINKIREL